MSWYFNVRKRPFSLQKGFFYATNYLLTMKRKKIKLTIWADPDAGFLQRVLLTFSRRRIVLTKFFFEGPDLREGLYCQLELEITRDSLEKIIRQIKNIMAVTKVIYDIVESGNLSAQQHEPVKEKELSIIT